MKQDERQENAVRRQVDNIIGLRQQEQNLFGIQLLQFKFSTVAQIIALMMRKRSGALHSDSEEEYIKLAQIAEQHSGLFYDEIQPNKARRKRKYAMSIAQQKQSASASQHQCPKGQPQINPFQSFDFDQQTDHFLRDCDQLAQNQRMRSRMTSKTHIVILCEEESWKVCKFLREKLGLSSPIQCSNPLDVIDLCVNHSHLSDPDAYFIDCFWVINKTHLSYSPNLLNIYIRTCTNLWDLTQMTIASHRTELKAPCYVSRHYLAKLLHVLYEARAAAHAAHS